MKNRFISFQLLSPIFVIKRTLSYFFLLVICSNVLADGHPHDSWEVTSFGTLGYTHTSKYDDLVIKRNITQRSIEVERSGWLIDSSLGVQVRKELEHNWDVVGQVVAKEKVNDSIEQSIEMAFLRYRSNDNWSFQLGRMVLDTFLLSDHRDVGYSYHTVRPQTEFYAWIPFSHYDGLKTTFEFGDFDSLVRFEVFLGKAKSTVNIGYLDTSTSYNYAKVAPIIGTGITWEKDDFTLRASIARFRFTQNTNAIKQLDVVVGRVEELWPESRVIADGYSIKDVEITYGSIGFKWTPGAWVVQSEFSDVNGDNFGNYDGQRLYLQVGRRFGEFLPYVSYAYSWDDREFPYDPPVFDDGLAFVLPGGQDQLDAVRAGSGAIYSLLKDNLNSGLMNQRSLSLGVRWDFASQKALKFQCDYATLEDGSLGIYPTQDTPEFGERNWTRDSRSWCSTTFDWVF